MLIDVLGYTFLAIFALTALMTLLSLPGWIPIPESYRKVLFKALLLEVIGAVIILFTNSFLKEPSTSTTYTLSDKNWVALNLDDGRIIQPTLEVVAPDDTLSITLGLSPSDFRGRLRKNQLAGVLSNSGMEIRNKEDEPLGVLPTPSLASAGFFNSIHSNEGELSSSSSFALVKYNKSPQGSWRRSGKYLKGCPLRFKVADANSQTVYDILDSEKGDTLFHSSSVAKHLFDVDHRINHFFEHKGQFYLFRIAGASLDKLSNSFVNVLQIKFSPTIKQ